MGLDGPKNDIMNAGREDTDPDDIILIQTRRGF
jgi:hypothetical protein